MGEEESLATESENEAIRTSAQYFFPVFIIPAKKQVDTTGNKREMDQNSPK